MYTWIINTVYDITMRVSSVENGNPASGTLSIAAMSMSDEFGLTGSLCETASYFATSSPLPEDNGSNYYFLTGSSLSESIQSLVDKINNSECNIVTASLSGSDTLFLTGLFTESNATFSLSYHNDNVIIDTHFG